MRESKPSRPSAVLCHSSSAHSGRGPREDQWVGRHGPASNRRYCSRAALVCMGLFLSSCGSSLAPNGGQQGSHPQGADLSAERERPPLQLRGGSHWRMPGVSAPSLERDSYSQQERMGKPVRDDRPNPSASVRNIEFESVAREDGALKVRIRGSGTLVVTTDGSLPDRNRPNDSTIIAERFVEISVARPTIIRTKSYVDGLESQLRSQSFVPPIVDLEVVQLPRDLTVSAVYVTGPFRAWSSAESEEYRLRRSPDGRYRIRIKGNRDERFIYKYVLKTVTGETVWWSNPGAPQTGSGDFTNNFAPSSLEMLEPYFLRDSPGFIEEAALDLRLQPVAALDQGDRVVRIRVGFLQGDVAAASLVFPNGQVAALTKIPYRRENIPYDQFTGLVTLPDADTETGFIVQAQDAGENLRLGSRGLLEPEENLTESNAFPFQYRAAEETLNDQDIYQIPLWAVDAVWYQIYPERFRNGDPSNDAPAPLPAEWRLVQDSDPGTSGGSGVRQTVRKWTSDWFAFDPAEQRLEEDVLARVPDVNRREVQRLIVINRRYGGDLQGVLDQIPHLKSLGVNAVYFNPVFESDSNHKYDTKDYRHIDRHFGPMRRNPLTGQPELLREDQRELDSEDRIDPSTWGFTSADKLFMKAVTALQDNGIRVVIDGVFNHSASNSEFMRDIARNGKASPFFAWFDMAYRGEAGFTEKKCNLADFFPDESAYPEAGNVAYEAWFGYCTLPNHREGFPETVFHPGFKAYLDAIIERWTAPKVVDGVRFRGVDGWRLDVYGDVSQDYWRLFRQKVKSIKKDALIIAEEWYDGFEILRGDQTDLLMNYTVRTLIESWFISTNERERFRPSMMADAVQFRLDNHREHVKYGLWSMLESHDTDRLISKTLYVNRGLSPRPQDGNSWDDGSVNRPDLGAPYSNDAPGPGEIGLFKTILGFQTAYMGAPILYYGSEFGMWGSDDPTDRKPMMWPDLFDGADTESRCVTYPGLWCKIQASVRFPLVPNMDVFTTVQRLYTARDRMRVLRRGSLLPRLNARVEGRSLVLGSPESDSLFLWGFERNFADQEYAYFVSNQNLARPDQSLELATKWPQGTGLIDLISGESLQVGPGGYVSLRIARDRGVLLVAADGQ